jgi:hypothetical protein
MLFLAVGLTGCGGGGEGGIDEGIDFGDSAPEVVSPSELEAAAGSDPVIEDEAVGQDTVDAEAEAPVAIAPPLDSPAPEPEAP